MLLHWINLYFVATMLDTNVLIGILLKQDCDDREAIARTKTWIWAFERIFFWK